MRQEALHPQTEAELDKSRRYGLRTLFVLILPLVLGYAFTDYCVGVYNAGRVGEADSNAFMRDEQLGYVSRPDYVGVWAAREEGEPEEIYERIMDSRYGATPNQNREGTTTLMAKSCHTPFAWAVGQG